MLINEIRNKINSRLQKCCKICGDTNCERDDEWIQPCACKGTLLWCHENCLKTWINYSNSKCCSICKIDFKLEYKNKRYIYLRNTIPLYISIFYFCFLGYISILITNTERYHIFYLPIVIRTFFIISYLSYLIIYYFIKIKYSGIVEQLVNPLILLNDEFTRVFKETHSIIYILIKNMFIEKEDYRVLNHFL